MDYFAVLGDELGIDWKNLSKALQSQPWTNAHFPLGKPSKEILYKLASWEIVPGTMTPNGADIRLRETPNMRSYLQGRYLNKSNEIDKNRYHLSREELMKFLTTGWVPPQQQSTLPGAIQ